MKSKILSLMALVIAGSFMFNLVATPQTAHAAGCTDARVLTFPAWYRGLVEEKNGDCSIKKPDQNGLSGFIWTIALNIVEIVLQVVVYTCIGYIIYGGFKYITQSDQSDGMVRARKTIQNAIIGLLISIFSVAIVNLVAAGM